ncbi:hypothetical protein EVAR_72509_1 [Eumeta japonica]|uniref:Uncharacterized protein n=1 Tax=Eumeta variegata TaxID=151549 RepID=A0A4C1TJ01_EUMVA|nr:hypothetical protein EVAR_72509_1 [Eumeta japonica]
MQAAGPSRPLASSFGLATLSLSALRPSKGMAFRHKWLKADKSFGLAPFLPSSLPEGWHSEQVARSRQAPQPRLAEFFLRNHPWATNIHGIDIITLEWGSKSNPIGVLSSEDSVRHYQTEALLGFYTPIAERQGVAGWTISSGGCHIRSKGGLFLAFCPEGLVTQDLPKALYPVKMLQLTKS